MATKMSTLKADRREGTGKGVARQLRMAGRLPAVLYGRDMESMHLSVDAHDAEYLFRHISVDNTIVNLEVAGEKELVPTLVREIQTHPWKPALMHVDFLRIQMGVEVEMDVPVNLVGTPIGVSLNGGVLEQIIHDLPIRCLPSMIPESIEVDVSKLDLHDSIHIADLTFGEGVEVMITSDRTVCAVSVPRAAEEAAQAAEAEQEGAAADAAAAAKDDDEG
jgi:large subunit ribosomal protein L25